MKEVRQSNSGLNIIQYKIFTFFLNLPTFIGGLSNNLVG